ncbi:MAG: glycoside hydrolase family 3 protein [Pseudobutyrivibrio sp.]|nr:glycoside hydrolase family 3 protein [Pseudobutyrivibrio sp.]
MEQNTEREFELAQDSVSEIDDGLTTPEETKALCRLLAAEGCVLVKNQDVLPINKDTKVAVFGRCQINYFYVGYGSGGDVKPPYKVSPMAAFKEAGLCYDKKLADNYSKWCSENVPDDGDWGRWPTCYPEMPITKDVVSEAAAQNDVALIFIGRSAGEDRETTLTPGSFYLTDEEEALLKYVTEAFDKVCVILNCGSIFDCSWIEKYNVGAVLFAWQGGQESGNAICDVLTGKVNPSGRLTDTIAPVESYPSTKNFGDKDLTVYCEDIYVGYRYFETFNKESVLYPFGYGLSYTTFETAYKLNKLEGSVVTVDYTVKNTGSAAGTQVLQVYASAPNGKLGKPARELVGFAKTPEIEPDATFSGQISCNLADISSFDDTGVTGHENCYILEAGTYRIFAGDNVRSAGEIAAVDIEETVIRQANEACPPDRVFERMVNVNGVASFEKVPNKHRDLKQRVLENLPKALEPVDKSFDFGDVKSGKISLEEFVAALSIEELETLSRGGLEAMNSPFGPVGNAGCFGGTCDSLQQKQVPAVSTNDGPSGARLQAHSTLYPIGAVLASSFNEELVFETVKTFGNEVLERKSHVLLAPGMNIHRNPLCGRNFEYFSEDPYLTARMGIAYVKGVQSTGASAVPKHVCCNNQETGRNYNNAVVSTRALREIYLRGFEKCIKEAKPDYLMTSYNKVNGVYTYYNYDLCTVLLREEFGFEGAIMTDWWIKEDKIPEFPDCTYQALRVRAGNNICMPGSVEFIPPEGVHPGESIFESIKKENGLTIGELQKNAILVLRACLKHCS